MLLLHGGPGVTHEYFEAFDSYFPGAGHRVLLLRPARLGLQRPARRRRSCGTCRASSRKSSRSARRSELDKDNFYLLGQSWGGMLAIEYALKYQQHLKGLVISNMMASIPAYNEYAQKVLMPAMDQKALAEIKQLEAAGNTRDPRYMELLMPNHYAQHLLRMPPEQWPDPVQPRVQAPQPRRSTCRCRARASWARAASSMNWDRTADLQERSRCRRSSIGAQLRHDGPEAHGVDGAAGAEGPLPATARTAATWRCTTTSRPTSPG